MTAVAYILQFLVDIYNMGPLLLCNGLKPLLRRWGSRKALKKCIRICALI